MVGVRRPQRRVQRLEVEDTARLLFEARSGAMGSVDLSWSLFADGLFTPNDSHNFKFGATWERLSDDERALLMGANTQRVYGWQV